MEFTRREISGIVILTLVGEIEIYNTGAVQAEVKTLIAEKKARVVLNMEAVPFIDSTGIGMVLQFQKNLRASGGALKLAKVSPAVDKVFHLTKLNSILEIFDSEEDAMSSFR
jgi:anti-anti-sigma factor